MSATTFSGVMSSARLVVANRVAATDRIDFILGNKLKVFIGMRGVGRDHRSQVPQLTRQETRGPGHGFMYFSGWDAEGVISMDRRTINAT
jgi:hypothetical protein